MPQKITFGKHLDFKKNSFRKKFKSKNFRFKKNCEKFKIKQIWGPKKFGFRKTLGAKIKLQNFTVQKHIEFKKYLGFKKIQVKN